MDSSPATNQEPDDAGLEIEISLTPGAELPEGEDPALRAGQELLPLGRPPRERSLVLGFSCLKQILAHGQRHPETEVAGVLLGDQWQCAGGPVCDLTEAHAATKTEAGLGHVTFSHETWQEIYTYLEQEAPDLRIVGWYHTHPGFGAFFSEQDRFIQRNFFTGAGQLGIVVDPQREQVAVFECQGAEVVEVPGLWISAPLASVRAARQLLNRLTFVGPQPAQPGLVHRLAEALGLEREGRTT
ncbi:MAG TPA: Mov34/MPN/PAD-1 family protein [Armatimonadota bacterium]|jgi:proteasome lid subunit RPN8/RPN11